VQEEGAKWVGRLAGKSGSLVMMEGVRAGRTLRRAGGREFQIVDAAMLKLRVPNKVWMIM